MRQLKISKSITPRNFQSLGKYFNDLDKIDLLKPIEEAEIARKIREGDPKALERLVTTNLRFVVSVAKQYQAGNLPLEDLINEGNIGLMIAATRFDESKGFKFVSYAVWWIRRSIITAIAEHARMIRLPYNQVLLLSRMNKAISSLEQLLNRKPSNEELAEILGVEPLQLHYLTSVSAKKISLDEPFSVDEGATLHDILPHGNRSDRMILSEAVKLEVAQALRVLSKRDRDVLTLYFGLELNQPVSLEDIAFKLGCTKEHVGRIKHKALERLRKCSQANILRACLSE